MEQGFLIVALLFFSMSIVLFALDVLQEGNIAGKERYPLKNNIAQGKIIKVYREKPKDREIKIILYNFDPGKTFELGGNQEGEKKFKRRFPMDFY